MEKVQDLIYLFRDALIHIPASSIAVEKLHACTQRNCEAHKAGRFAVRIQENSYILSSVLEHSKLKKEIEHETIGACKFRAGQLLHRRVVSRTLPGKARSRIKPTGGPTRTTVLPLAAYFFR